MATAKNSGKSKSKSKELIAAQQDSMEFRKTNEAIGLRVSEGHLSLLSRKIFNVMVYHAQQMGKPGENAPIQSEVAKSYYWITLAAVAKDAAYDSNDTQLLKEHVEELQNIRIHMEDDKQWTSERLVSSVKLVNPNGLKKKGGQVWFGFAFPPEVSHMVMSPGTYTKLSLYYQTLLRSGSSLALYEIARRYATNPTKVTRVEPWEWWYGSLTGNPVTGSLPEYKYFKRDVIKTSIAEINALTDLHVELIEHKAGRKVVALQFKVGASSQPSLQFPAPPIIDWELVKRVMDLGIAKEEACNLTVMHEESKLKATLDIVEKRMRSTAGAKLDSPAAYLKIALRDGYANPQDVAKQTVKAAVALAEPQETIRERYLRDRAKDAMAMFNEFDDEQKAELLLKFKATGKPKALNMSKGLASALVRSAFSTWLAEQTWPAPTDADLLEYAGKIGLSK
jgi:hypothetical protein